MERTSSVQTFSTRSAARILAVSPDRIRYWVKRRLVKPFRVHGRGYEFGFNDLLVMRLTKELLPTRHRLQPIRRCFERLGQLLDPERPVTALKLFEEGGRMVVRDGSVMFEAETGQLILDFNVTEFREELERRAGGNVRNIFQRENRVDESNPARAIELYRSIIEKEPHNADAHLHLAALHERRCQLLEALRNSLAAALLEPESADVHLHLAILYRKREEPEKALNSFLRAVKCDPDLVEAHRHLAELYERMGRKREALRHLSALHRLTRGQ